MFANKSVEILNNILMNTFPTFIPNKFVALNEKDLLWMSEYLNNKFKWRNKIYAEYLNKDNNDADYTTLQNAIMEALESVGKSKYDYHNQLAKKLSSPKTSSKTYWYFLKTFYNEKKVPLILPLMKYKKLESDF